MQESAERAVSAAGRWRHAPSLLQRSPCSPSRDSVLGAVCSEQAESDLLEAAALVESLVARRSRPTPRRGDLARGGSSTSDRYAEADAHAGRALAVARATGEGLLLALVQILGAAWRVRGKLADAGELLGNGGYRGSAPARRHSGARMEICGPLGRGAHGRRHRVSRSPPRRRASKCRASMMASTPHGRPVRLAATLLETGQPERASSSPGVVRGRPR